METYHKIQTLFKRHLDGPKKGKMIRGQWTNQELEYLSDNLWDFSEKVDGTNIRIGYNHPYRGAGSNWQWGVQFAGRTDRAQLPKPLLASLEGTFTEERFKGAFPELESTTPVTLFGEGYGVDIQNGGNYVDAKLRNDKEALRQFFVLFDVKIGDFWLDRTNVEDVAKKLDIQSVPSIGQGTLHDAIDIVSSGITFNDAGAIVRWGSGGLKSQWGDFEAEGIVARPVVPLFNRKGDRIITKIKAVDFK